MKHTKNTHHVLLDKAEEYTILKHHKNQNLVLIKGEQPAQRWVDDNCFSTSQKHTQKANVSRTSSKVLHIEDELSKALTNMSTPKYTKKYEKSNTSKQNLLTLSWHNAFCETHRYKKECRPRLFPELKQYSAKHFVLHGLWPQPKSKMYCGVSKKHVGMDKHKQWNRLPDLGLSSQTKEALKRVMPGFSSSLHKHEWFKHGTCYGTNAQQYYTDAVRLVRQVNDSKVGAFFMKNIGKFVTLKQVRQLFDTSFGTGTGKHVELKCKNGLITELWLHLGSGSDRLSDLLQKGKVTRSRCQKGRIDKAGFGR
jgi:ribonuclease T2